MRLAGTCSRYSKSAIPQLANAATYHGRDDKLRRWAYQANVMKTFEAMRRQTVTTIVRIDADGNAGVWGNGTRSFATPTGIGRFGEAPGNNNQPTGTLIFASSRMRTMAFLRRAKNESPE